MSELARIAVDCACVVRDIYNRKRQQAYWSGYCTLLVGLATLFQHPEFCCFLYASLRGFIRLRFLRRFIAILLEVVPQVITVGYCAQQCTLSI